MIVSGLVQGVWFRAYTQRQARELGLVGTVRNLSDGSVEIVAEGSAEAVKALVSWAWQGSPMARVDDVTVEDVPSSGDSDSFEVSF
jgi:acylphosphatase